jgi:hypothetical protein
VVDRTPARGYWLIPFTDDELEAIYDAIELRPPADPLREATLERVLHKITPSRVGDSRPDGAVDAR